MLTLTIGEAAGLRCALPLLWTKRWYYGLPGRAAQDTGPPPRARLPEGFL